MTRRDSKPGQGEIQARRKERPAFDWGGVLNGNSRPPGSRLRVTTTNRASRPSNDSRKTHPPAKPPNWTFVLLSFEGPDPYSRAGGLASRVTGLAEALAGQGFDTHLFFIGDPDRPGHEVTASGRLRLHRWCQWISRYHPAGVYDGEQGKVNDWSQSVPRWLVSELIPAKLASDGRVVVLAEEWQTVGSILGLDRQASLRGWRNRVHLLWNANNSFGFHRIPWSLLKSSASVVTVSRYMKHMMWDCGVDARVLPNGIPQDWLRPVEPEDRDRLLELLRDRLALVKVARWDPDKRWIMAVDAVAILKSRGMRPLLIARGGLEEHGTEVIERAKQKGLGLSFVRWDGSSTDVLIEALRPSLWADMVVLEGFLSEPQRRALFHTADVVLANSGLEPFGLVGLETMAVGGVAFVGCTGEDYATHRYDAITLQTSDPREIVHHALTLQSVGDLEHSLREASRRTASRYTWPSVLQRVWLPFLEELTAPLGTLPAAVSYREPKRGSYVFAS